MKETTKQNRYSVLKDGITGKVAKVKEAEGEEFGSRYERDCRNTTNTGK